MSALAKTAEVTVYCVQPFWRNGKGALAQGRLRQFKDRDAALREAHRAAGVDSNVGVIAFEITGAPEFDSWGEPILLVQYGDVPELGN